MSEAKIDKSQQVECVVEDEQTMLSLGGKIAKDLNASSCVIYLHGDLGAGKTTLTKGIMQGLGVKEKIKSPTYTLVETYPLSLKTESPKSNFTAYHFDLYRLSDPEELEFMGMRDYDTDNSILIIEWPNRGEGFLPKADIHVYIDYFGEKRKLRIVGSTDRGAEVINPEFTNQ